MTSSPFTPGTKVRTKGSRWFRDGLTGVVVPPSRRRNMRYPVRVLMDCSTRTFSFAEAELEPLS